MKSLAPLPSPPRHHVRRFVQWACKTETRNFRAQKNRRFQPVLPCFRLLFTCGFFVVPRFWGLCAICQATYPPQRQKAHPEVGSPGGELPRRWAPPEVYPHRSLHDSLQPTAALPDASQEKEPHSPRQQIEIADGKAPRHVHGIGVLPLLRRGRVGLPRLPVILVQVWNMPLPHGILQGDGRLSQAFQPSAQGTEGGRLPHELIEGGLSHLNIGFGVPIDIFPCGGGRRGVLILLIHKKYPRNCWFREYCAPKRSTLCGTELGIFSQGEACCSAAAHGYPYFSILPYVERGFRAFDDRQRPADPHLTPRAGRRR